MATARSSRATGANVAAPAQAGAATSRADVAAVRRADLDFFAALLAGDIPRLEVLLAEDFLIVDVMSGSVHPRPAFLEAIDAGLVTFQDIETFPLERTIRLVGTDVGIVIGRTTLSLKSPGGPTRAVGSRYTHVFRAAGRSWQLVSAQGTPISRS
jgi:ketosteroid isomerase-like protein